MAVTQNENATSSKDAQEQSRTSQEQSRQDRSRNETQRRQGNLPAIVHPLALMSPFTLLQRFFENGISDLFDEGVQRRDRSAQENAARSGQAIAFAPRIDVVQRGNELVVRADLPGVNPDDVVVEISDDAITISGERAQERTEEHDGVYRVERTYGSFYREIPLPEGTITDQAKASFNNGVLEITVPAPPEQASRGRRLQVTAAEKANGGETNRDAKRGESKA